MKGKDKKVIHKFRERGKERYVRRRYVSSERSRK